MLSILPPGSSTPRDHSQLVAFQGELWMIGGRSPSRTTGIVSIFDPASETWRAGPLLATPRAGFAAASSGTLLVVAGGELITENPWRTISSVEAIAAGQGQWSALPTMPMPVHGVPGVMHGNAFYALGGSTQAGAATNPGAVQALRW